MENKFILEFAKDLTKLAGNRFGKSTYEGQVKNDVDLSLPIVIVFPERINRVASSFIQGFFEEVIQQVGINGIEENITFETSIPNFKQFVLDNLG